MNEIKFILYSLSEEEEAVQVVVKDETIWCTQKAMASLFGVGVPAISKHLTHIYEEGELIQEATVSKMEIVQLEGARNIKRETDFYYCRWLPCELPSCHPFSAVGYQSS